MAGERENGGPLCLDLFCGIGGLTSGLEAAGLHCVGGVDSWHEARATFEHNHAPLRCMEADLGRTPLAKIENFFDISAADVDIVAGGPPCQGFSTVGKREAADPRNSLWTAFRDLVGSASGSRASWSGAFRRKSGRRCSATSCVAARRRRSIESWQRASAVPPPGWCSGRTLARWSPFADPRSCPSRSRPPYAHRSSCRQAARRC